MHLHIKDKEARGYEIERGGRREGEREECYMTVVKEGKGKREIMYFNFKRQRSYIRLNC